MGAKINGSDFDITPLNIAFSHPAILEKFMIKILMSMSIITIFTKFCGIES